MKELREAVWDEINIIAAKEEQARTGECAPLTEGHEALTEELVFADHEKAWKVAEMLLKEDYIVMVSREDDLLVINCGFFPGADRNLVEVKTWY